LNKGDFTKTTLPIVWLLFTLLAVETYNLSSKFPTKIHQTALPRFKNVIFRRHYVMQKHSSCIETEKLSLQSSSRQRAKLNVDRPT